MKLFSKLLDAMNDLPARVLELISVALLMFIDQLPDPAFGLTVAIMKL